MLLEGGGSGTWIGPFHNGGAQWERQPPLGLRRDVESVGAEVATAVQTVAGIQGAEITLVVAALSTVTSAASAESIAEEIATELGCASCGGPVVVACNDALPLLSWHPGVASVAAICGTGTGYMARDSTGTIRRASGAEFVLSDEGGGFDVGLAGLRAAIRGRDGRDVSTILTDAAIEFGGGTYERLWSFVYDLDIRSLKQRVASFAPRVLDAAAGGDEASLRIVGAAADQIVSGIVAVTRSMPPGETKLLLAGSLLCSSTRIGLRLRVQDALTRRGLEFRTTTVAGDARASLVALASELVCDAGRFAESVLSDSSAPVAVVR